MSVAISFGFGIAVGLILGAVFCLLAIVVATAKARKGR